MNIVVKYNVLIVYMFLLSFLSIHYFNSLTNSLTLNRSISQSNVTNTYVYICKGPNSKRYHYVKDCRGLNSCSTKIYKVNLAEAEELGRTLCGWED